jgi:2-keto-3-deoxy-L-rhamnonate aldolase RhmA
MKPNRIKQVMREGGLALVSHVGFADPAVVEIIASAGFDGAFIDMEHSIFDLQTVGEMIRVADLCDITPVVRVPDENPKTILRLLDMGARVFRCPTSPGQRAPGRRWRPSAIRRWETGVGQAAPGRQVTARSRGWNT